MSDVRASIIMPVYNTEKELLRTCIGSIQKQTCNLWDLWIVDDGSRADVAEYCESFTADSRIRVIHQKNSGVSDARNNGTLKSSGEYVMYVDSDDILADYVIEESLQLAQKHNADIVYGGVQKVNNQENFAEFATLRGKSGEEKIVQLDSLRARILGCKEKGLSDIQGKGYVGRGPWAKLIRRELAVKTHFPHGLPIGEDIIWSLRLLNLSQCCVVANSIWYGYVVYQSSAISKYYGNREEIVKRWYDIVKEENKAFFSKYPQIEGRLIAREFYCIIHFDILATQNHESVKLKNARIYDLLRRKPWSTLNEKEYKRCLTKTQKGLMIFCNIKLGATVVKLYLDFKHIVQKMKSH